MPLISIVVVTWNSKKVLTDCVSSMFAHVPEETFELILVDNNSLDQAYLYEYEAAPNIQVIRNSDNLGFSKAVNIGLRRATGKYFLVLNPDIIFTTNPFPRLIEELLKDPKIGVIGPLLHGVDGRRQIKHYYPRFPSAVQFIVFRSILAIIPPFPALALRFFHARVGTSGVYFVDQIPGAFLLFHRDLFGSENALCEAYFIWMEDVDFCLRVHRMNLKVAVLANENITHVGGTSFDAWDDSRKRLMFTRSYMTYLGLHFGLISYLVHVLLMAFNSMTFFLLAPRYYFRYGFKGMKARLRMEKNTLAIVLNHLKSHLRFSNRRNRSAY